VTALRAAARSALLHPQQSHGTICMFKHLCRLLPNSTGGVGHKFCAAFLPAMRSVLAPPQLRLVNTAISTRTAQGKLCERLVGLDPPKLPALFSHQESI